MSIGEENVSIAGELYNYNHGALSYGCLNLNKKDIKMRIEKGDHIDIQGVSDEVFDACVAVAVASGFSINNIDDETGGRFWLHNDIDGLWTFSGYADTSEWGKPLTINEWLFSLAPDWADNVDKYDDEYYYSNDSHCCRIVEDKPIRKNDQAKAKAKAIATRDTKNWVPKVGENVMYKSSNDITVKAVDGCEAWVNLGGRGSRIVNVSELKPKPSAEEELIAEMVKAAEQDFSYEIIARHLMKIGYKKC